MLEYIPPAEVWLYGLYRLLYHTHGSISKLYNIILLKYLNYCGGHIQKRKIVTDASALLSFSLIAAMWWRMSDSIFVFPTRCFRCLRT